MIFKVQICPEHIERGCAKNGHACPLFFAMIDAGLPVKHITAYAWTDVPYAEAKNEDWFRLPEIAEDFVYHFDNHEEVYPIGFDIEYDTSRQSAVPVNVVCPVQG